MLLPLFTNGFDVAQTSLKHLRRDHSTQSSMHDQMEEMTSPMSITMLDNEMEGEIGRFKMLQENEKLRQEIKELRESQWRRANSENLTSFQRRNQEFADSKLSQI